MDISPTTDRILAYLDLPQLATKQPRVSAIAVTSLDGRATINGVSGGLGNALDARIFNTHRALADVVFVGAGTIKAEEYGPVEVPNQLVAVRRELGKADSVPIATISRSLSLDARGPMFDAPRIDEASNDSTGSVLIFTASPADAAQPKGAARQTHTKNDGAIDLAAWKERRQALVAAGAQVIELPELSAHAAIDWLKDHGFAHIACEGGPSIYEQLLRAGDVTNLYLTVAPWWVGSGPATLSSYADSPVPHQFSLVDTIVSDSHIFLHYLLGKTH